MANPNTTFVPGKLYKTIRKVIFECHPGQNTMDYDIILDVVQVGTVVMCLDTMGREFLMDEKKVTLRPLNQAHGPLWWSLEELPIKTAG